MAKIFLKKSKSKKNANFWSKFAKFKECGFNWFFSKFLLNLRLFTRLESNIIYCSNSSDMHISTFVQNSRIRGYTWIIIAFNWIFWLDQFLGIVKLFLKYKLLCIIKITAKTPSGFCFMLKIFVFNFLDIASGIHLSILLEEKNFCILKIRSRCVKKCLWMYNYVLKSIYDGRNCTRKRVFGSCWEKWIVWFTWDC